VLKLLADNKDKIKALADELLVKETMSYEEVKSLLKMG
jgi:ATP-dependent Zn protease